MKLFLKLSVLIVTGVACSKHTVLPEPAVTVKPKPGVDTVKGSPKSGTYSPDTLRVVVIGSSTAQGIGPLSKDSTLVSRTERWLAEKKKPFKVTNLAVGGTTTFFGLPYKERVLPYYNDTTRNTDAAIRLKANVAIISYPSNDFTLDITAKMIERNFDIMVDALFAKNIKPVIIGIQPRSFNATQVAMQAEVDDYLKNKHGIKYVQVYHKLKNPDGSIKQLYGSGDGVHLNNTGHKLLFDNMVAQCGSMFE